MALRSAAISNLHAANALDDNQSGHTHMCTYTSPFISYTYAFHHFGH